MTSIRALVAALSLSTVALTSCMSTGAQLSPGTGPATQPTEASTSEPAPSETATDEPDPSDSPTDAAVGNFKDRYTYTDDVEVEVITIHHGKVTEGDAEYADAKAGSAWVSLTVRVKNGSKTRIKDAYSISTVTYGADGDEADNPYLSSEPDSVSITGTILPGKSKVATDYFLIPTKAQGDVTLEFDFDSDHQSAVFTGSVK